MPNTCYMLCILAFTHNFLSFQMLHEIWRCIGVARFGLVGQCEGLSIVERVTKLAPRFLFYVLTYFAIAIMESAGIEEIQYGKQFLLL